MASCPYSPLAALDVAASGRQPVGLKLKSIGENVRESQRVERGEFLKRFAEKTGRTIPFIAFKLQGVPTEDLYAFEKQCDSYKGPWSKAFFGALKVKPTP